MCNNTSGFSRLNRFLINLPSRWLLSILGVFLAWVLPLEIKAQTTMVTVGTGTNTTNVSPINSYYRHSWTECIYPASAIDQSGYINRVGWECSDAYAFSMYTMKIYMGTTPNATHSNSTSWLPMDQLTLVYSGTNVVTPNTAGWYYVDLDEAFEYDGGDNLVVVVSKTAPSWISALKYYCSNVSNSVLYRRSDTYEYYADHPGTASGTTAQYLANIRLFMSPVACPSAHNITISDITEESAVVTWEADTSNNAWLVGWGTTADEAQLNTTVVQSNSLLLSNLIPETTYYFSIQSVCDTVTSGFWKTRSFKTLCAGTFLSGGCFDLTDLSSSGITCTYGSFSNPYLNTGVIDNRHVVLTEQDYDPYTNNTLPTIPDCRDYSVRLGNSSTGAQGESISLNYVVDSTQADLLLLDYAVVMEDPNHTPAEQPRFTLEILDGNNQLINPICGYDDFVASSGLGWSSSGGVIWNEWTTVGMDISSYHGQQVKVRLTTRDCDQGGHFGYAYFILDCGSKRMKSDFCGLDTIRSFTAPAGFRYQWSWEHNPDSVISTDRTVTFHEDHDERILCRVTSLSKDNCTFTIYGSLEPRYPIAGFDTYVLDSCSRTCEFHNGSLVSIDGITPNSNMEPCDNALWDFGDGTISHQINPTHVYDAPGTYQVMLVSGLHDFACSDTAYYTLYFPPATQSMDTMSCTPVQINGAVYATTGDYIQHLTSHQGCDSVLNVHVTMQQPYYFDETITVCDSLTWLNGVTYYESTNTPTYVMTASNGCDSVLTLHLTVNHSVTSIDEHTVCDSMTWINGVTYYESTDTATYVLTAANGCDSVVMLHLTVNHFTTGIDEQTACDSMTWINGVTYYENIDTVSHVLTGAAGCDSIVTLHLTVNYSNTGIDSLTACDAMTWMNGVTYHESTNTPTYVLTNAAGCDSTVTLHLTVNHSVATDDYQTIPQNALPYTYLDTVFNVGTPEFSVVTFSLTKEDGCDSIVTLHLTVLPNMAVQVDTTVCAADMPFTWHEHTFTAAGSHVVTLLSTTGVDSVVTYMLAVDNLAASAGDITHVTCYGESTGAATAIVTAGTAPLTYQWTNAAGTSLSTTTSVNNRPAGNYTFTVTDQIGCASTFTVTINQLNNELVPGTISEDQELCNGEVVATFTGTPASGGDNGAYQWQISTDGTEWNLAPGVNNMQNYTYPDLAESGFMLRRAWTSQSCGTVFSNTVTITVWNSYLDTVISDICLGNPYQEYGFDISEEQLPEVGEYVFEQHLSTGHCDSTVVLMLTVHPLYDESFEDEICEGSQYDAHGFVIMPMETVGVEEIERVQNLQSIHGCDSVVRLNLTVIDTALRIVPLTEDFCEQMEMELMVVTPMPNYVWNTGEQSPNITVTTPGYYSVTATQGDCISSAEYRVNNCQIELYLPDAITPSRNEGLNDWFCLPEKTLISILQFEISIFNRWGEMVFYSTDKAFKWNGEYRGSIQYNAVYIYVINYTDVSGRPKTKKGTVVVL